MFFLTGGRSAPENLLLSFGLTQKKVTKEKLKFWTKPTARAFPAPVSKTGFTEPLRG